MQTYTTNSFEETQVLGEELAYYLSSSRKRGSRVFAPFLDSRLHGNDRRKGAVVLGLSGNLGGGKTTFMQGFAKGLGINEKILSPTYVILKRFSLPSLRGHSNARSNPKAQIASSPEASRNDGNFTDFYHIDCYRINKPEEILELDFKKIVSNPKNIVAVEWPEKIKKYMPGLAFFLRFEIADDQSRNISIEGFNGELKVI